MGYSEEDLLPISGLQHMVYCDRQAALIHIDRVWADNALTVEGSHLHRIVDDGRGGVRDGRRTLRAITLRSMRLGLFGKADVVELHRADDPGGGVVIPSLGSARWSVVPVEYKRGRPKPHRADEVQLCAQAICLEEAFGAVILSGSLYYGKERHRTEVSLDEGLRQLTADTAIAFHDLIDSATVPIRQRDARCDRCSLQGVCMPPKRTQPESASRFLREWISATLAEGGAG
jgi:CRISPR-associated exonuclease Cas4